MSSKPKTKDQKPKTLPVTRLPELRYRYRIFANSLQNAVATFLLYKTQNIILKVETALI
jgi:hypothetical protein